MYKRKCGLCNVKKTYKHKTSFDRAVAKNALCRSCASKLNKSDRHGPNNGMYGRTHSKSTRDKISAKNKGMVVSEDKKRIMSIRMAGNRNPMAGKTFYQAWLEKVGKELADIKLAETKIRRSIAKGGNGKPKPKKINRRFPNRHANYKGNEHICGTYFNNLICNARNRGIKVYITLDDIWQKSVEQGHICIFTGRTLKFPNECSETKDRTRWNASVDRIDSKKDYTVDNIQIIDKSLQRIKRDLSNEEFLSLVLEIANAQNNTKRN